MITAFIQSLVRGYKKALSPTALSTCRFTPTCSDYALESLERYGAFFGLPLAVWRIVRCNPFTRGGLDTVPTKLFEKHTRTHNCQIGIDGKHPGERGVSAASREQSAMRGTQSAKHDGMQTAQRLAAEPWSQQPCLK